MVVGGVNLLNSGLYLFFFFASILEKYVYFVSEIAEYISRDYYLNGVICWGIKKYFFFQKTLFASQGALN